MSSVSNTIRHNEKEEMALMMQEIAQLKAAAVTAAATAAEEMAAKTAENEELKKKTTSLKIRKIKKLNIISPLSKKELKRKIKWFKNNRKAQYNLGMKVLNKIKNGERNVKKIHLVVVAEEKSGKREISEIINLKLRLVKMATKNPKDLLLKKAMKNVYIDGLHVCGLVRKSCEPQYEELRKLGIYAEAVGRVNDSIDYLDNFNSKKGEKTGIIILDELDYASAKNSTMEPFIKEENSHIIAMSSTPWDATKTDWCHVNMEFEPAAEYCGGAWFVQQGLVIEPTSFITDKLEFSEQAKLIISNCGKKRNVVVVRLPTRGKEVTYRSYKAKKNCAPNENLEESIHIKESFIDANSEMTMEQTILCGVGEAVKNKIKDCSMVHIIYICGKYTRSTELPPYVKSSLYAWHDARMLKEGSCLQAVSQALGRIKHYKSLEYPDGHRIFMYADLSALNYWSDPAQNEKKMKKLSSRTKSSKVRDTSDIKSMKFDTLEKAIDFKLKELHSETSVTIFKARLREGENGEAVTADVAPDGRIMNNIRGTWKIIDASDESDYSYGLSGAGSTHDGGARLIVVYNDNVPTYVVVWRKESSDAEEKQTTYKHEPTKKNAWNESNHSSNRT